MDRQLPVSVWPEWKITEKIGEGSFGKVYKAERTVQDKTFYSAIKVITIPGSQGELESVRSENNSEQSTRAYFQGLVEECIQEVSTMEYFRGNSHIVSVEDYKVVEYLDAIGWDIFIRMEYLTSFLDYCAEKQLKEEDVLQMGIDLCKALECCQQMNIIHRDIKPENIFVSRFGEFKLGDFGIARELEQTLSSFSKKGTYSYMAPEMYRGEAYDIRVDIYSLGLVLYKLLNHNRLPFLSLEKQLITYRDKENALGKRMSGEEMPLPVDAGEGFGQIIRKACAYRCEERYQTATDFRADLERLKNGQFQLEQKPLEQKPLQQKPLEQKRAAEAVKVPEQVPEQGTKRVPEQEAPKKRMVSAEDIQKIVATKLEEEAEKERMEARMEELRRQSLEKQRNGAPERKKLPEKRTSRKVQQKKSRKRKQRTRTPSPLLWAVIVMGIAVCIAAVIFVRMLLDHTDGNYDSTGQMSPQVQVYDETGEHTTKLSGQLQEIKAHATEIVTQLNAGEYQSIGSEEEGVIQYKDGEGDIKKILVYPSVSEKGVFEEYYFWNGELFFAYIWKNSNIDSSIHAGEQKANLYYYDNGELIRWIDEDNICHDSETENKEYVERGTQYLDNSQKYMAYGTGTDQNVNEAGG